MNVTKYDPAEFGNRYTEVWGVQSESKAGTIYTVALNKKGVWSCGCPRWTMNKSRPDCKHITHIKSFAKAQPGKFSQTEKMPDKVIKALNRFSAIEV